MIDLDALEALERAATPAPWRRRTTADGETIYADDALVADVQGWITGGTDKHDAELIVNGRNALQALIAEVRRLRSNTVTVEVEPQVCSECQLCYDGLKCHAVTPLVDTGGDSDPNWNRDGSSANVYSGVPIGARSDAGPAIFVRKGKS